MFIELESALFCFVLQSLKRHYVICIIFQGILISCDSFEMKNIEINLTRQSYKVSVLLKQFAGYEMSYIVSRES